MKKFLAINKTKLVFIGGVVLLFSLCLFSSLYFLPFSSKPSKIIQILAQLGFSILTSFLLLLLIFFNGYHYHVKQQIFFKREELSAILTRYHFRPCLVNVSNRWQLTFEAFTGQVNGFQVMLRSSRQSPNYMDVSVLNGLVPDTEIPDFTAAVIIGQLKPNRHLEKDLEDLLGT